MRASVQASVLSIPHLRQKRTCPYNLHQIRNFSCTLVSRDTSPRLCKPVPRLLQPVLGNARLFRGFQLIHLLLAGDDINLVDRDVESGSEPKLVTNIQNEEDWEGNISSDEVLGVEGHECLETVGDGEKTDNSHRSIRGVWLERSLVR